VSFKREWEFGDADSGQGGWLFGIPNPFPFDIFGRSVFEGWNPFPSGPYFPARPRVPDVISEIPDTWEEYEEQFPEAFEPILETRPGRVPDPWPGSEADTGVDPRVILGDPYAVDTAEQDDEEQPMAHDWGHLIRQGIGGIFGLGGDDGGGQQFAPLPPPVLQGGVGLGLGTQVAGGDCDGMAWSGGTPPKGYKVVNYCGKGVLRKVRRRRRRRLLTASDSRDIATIVGLVGKGQMASALINRR